MPVGYLSDDTTVFSNVSLTGTLAAANLSATTLTGSFSTLTVANAIKVGGGTAITSILKGTVSIVTMTMAASSSATTSATVAGLATTDIITIRPPNTLSGLSMHCFIDAWVSAASTLIVRFSNTSTAQVVQAGPVSYLYAAIRS